MGAASLLTAGPADAQDTEGLIPPDIDYTDEEVDILLGLIDDAMTVLPQEYPAEADSLSELSDELAEIGNTGYYNFGATAPGGYEHFINREYVVDGIYVDPYRAESLVYQRQADGSLDLVSAMYMGGIDEHLEDLPEEIQWYPGWHGHPELCTTPDGGFGGITDPDDPDCPEGTSQALTPLMFHVWIAEDNPCDHRFGGIGVSGVHCEIHHDHDNGDHDDHDDGDHDDHDDGDHGDDHGDDHDDDHDGHDDGHGDGHGDGHDDDHDGHGDHDHVTSPAPAVDGDPITLTG